MLRIPSTSAERSTVIFIRTSKVNCAPLIASSIPAAEAWPVPG
jgi:hypothetical protein